ncbi:MAG: glutamine synthetase type III, partial [Lachnospiraceae bacterium]|nr:glutamine synthetase type III [Lachnospiraceae bacterium]
GSHETEVTARHEVKLENYCKILFIEAQTMLEMTRRDILPAMSRFAAELSSAITARKAVMGDSDLTYEKETLRTLSALMGSTYSCVKELEQDLLKARTIREAAEQAEMVKTVIVSDMSRLRLAVDQMEVIGEGKQWPYPTYGEILYGIR